MYYTHMFDSDIHAHDLERDEAKEFLHASLDAALMTDEYYIVIGRKGFLGESDEVVMIEVEGKAHDDVAEIIVQTLGEI